MKKILLILVGGTICTALNDKGTLSVSENAGAVITENFKNSASLYKDKAEFVVTRNLFILSENMTVEKWNLIIDTYREYISKDNYEGVIFAHGTDTLAYSAALFSLLLSDTDIPVFFVSSNARLDSPKANGNDNFAFAVESICRSISPNIYVPYKNITDGQMYLHLASRLEQCRNYSDDFFSKGAINVTGICEKNYKKYFDEITNLYPAEKRKAIFNIMDDLKLCECVLKLSPYVGINYGMFDYKQFLAVLHGAYHSGTACAQDREDYDHNSILYMLDLCDEAGVDAYFSPSKPCGEVYDTVRVIDEHNKKINFLYGYTNEMAYVKLLVAYSLFKNKKDIESFIETEQNFERIDK